MPFTPFHFGPSSCVALCFRKHIDLPVFIFANIVVDIEPLMVILLSLDYPLHGYCHTLLVGSLVGIIWAFFAYSIRRRFEQLMRVFHLSYDTNFRKILISSVFGIWFHVFMDAFLYTDIKPFYPFKVNPLYGKLTPSTVYSICTLSFIPAWLLYIRERRCKCP